MQKRPSTVINITAYLGFLFLIGFLPTLAGIFTLFSQPNWQLAFCASFFVLPLMSWEIGVLMIAHGFYNLKSWAYKPAKLIIDNERGSNALGFPAKIASPEIKRAFGVEEPTE